MKFRSFPVIITAALTSVMTFFIADKYAARVPYFAEGPRVNVPVNYAAYTSGAAGKMAPPTDFRMAAEASVKAVVHIKTTTNAKHVIANDPVFEQFFGQAVPRQYQLPPQAGSGSGVVISPDGYIVTNNHVVTGADKVTVTFNDRFTTEARVLATDPSTDIALLKVEEKNLPYMEFGNSDDVTLGQWVLAVGYPLTLDATVTAGIVSAKSRSIGINRSQSASAIESFIQTDAAVNPGNSGGALVNTSGQLIGINSAIASPTGSYAGYSYAIPANLVRKVVNDLTQYGSVQRAYLGIQLMDIKNATAEELGALGIERADGVYVNDVIPNGGAATAGIRKGDFITQVNGVPVHTEPELLEQIARYKPGDNISVNYMRSGNVKMTTVLLKNVENTTNIIKKVSSVKMLGADFRTLTNEDKRKYNVSSGVQVTDISDGAIASQTNMKEGFVITSINEQSVRSVEELQRIVGTNTGTALQISGFYPGSKGMYYYALKDINNTGGEQ